MSVQLALSDSFVTENFLNNKDNKWINSLLTVAIKETRNYTDNVLGLNEIKDPLIKSNLLMIRKYIDKSPKIFSEYKKIYPDLFNIDHNTIRLKYNHEIYINNFFQIINENAELSVHYQELYNDKWNIFIHEGLLRIWWIDGFNHFDYIELHNHFWKWIYTFFNVLGKIFSDINKWIISWGISMNVEVDEIENDNFFKILKFLKEKYNIDFKKQKIIFEILENQKIPNTEKFKEKLSKLKMMGIDIAFDDVFSEKVPLEDVIRNLNYAWTDIDIIKIDWKMLQSFYSIYKTANSLFSEWFVKLRNALLNISKRWVKIVAEWIEDMEMLNFAKNILWVKYFQWFFSNKEENIKILQNNG